MNSQSFGVFILHMQTHDMEKEHLKIPSFPFRIHQGTMHIKNTDYKLLLQHI